MTESKSNQQHSLLPGYVVALTLKPGAAPLDCYVGEVQTVDSHGVRITLIDWMTGLFTHFDFFAPWESITSALVATPEHSRKSLAEEFANYQEKSTKDSPNDR